MFREDFKLTIGVFYIGGKQCWGQGENKTLFFLNSYRTLVKSFPDAKFCKRMVKELGIKYKPISLD